ncbi:MAG: hypothetical protein VKJ06_01290 [Vampirovibrionales bacterium]|nr:hypothetical protein [Vampirovibrionales bacterium]
MRSKKAPVEPKVGTATNIAYGRFPSRPNPPFWQNMARSQRILGVLGVVFLLATPIIYGLRVQVESYIQGLAEATKAEQIDNQIKQTVISRLESFQATSRLMSQFPELKRNTRWVEVPVKTRSEPKDPLWEKLYNAIFFAGNPEATQARAPQPLVPLWSASNQY